MRKDKNGTWIDLQCKFNGLVRAGQYDHLQIDPSATFSVTSYSEEENFLLLAPTSRSTWSATAAWTQARRALHSYIQVCITAVQFYRHKPLQISGLLVTTPWGIEGFIPTRHLHSKSPVELVGQHLWVKVIEVNQRNNDLILSQRCLLKEHKHALLSHPELITTGTIIKFLPFGLVLDVGYGVTVLLRQRKMDQLIKNDLLLGQPLSIGASLNQAGELAITLRQS